MKSLFILAFLLTAAMAQNPCDCGAFVTTPIPGTNDYAMVLKYSLSKENIQPPPQTCNPVDKYQQWHHQCIYTLSCSTISDSTDRSLFFKSFNINSKSGGSVQIGKFTITNPGMLSTPLISFDEVFIPEQQGGAKKFSYAPNVLVGISKTQYADLYYDFSSTTVMADKQVDEVDVSIEFTCSVYTVGKKRGSDEKGKTACIIVGFILPLVIALVYIILAIVRANNPELLSKVRAWAGFKEVNENESMGVNLKPAEEKAYIEQPAVDETVTEEKSEGEKSSEGEENDGEPDEI